MFRNIFLMFILVGSFGYACEGEECDYYCPECYLYYEYTGEDDVIDKLPSWPAKHEDPFMDALSN